jgi:hypothetical protein
MIGISSFWLSFELPVPLHPRLDRVVEKKKKKKKEVQHRSTCLVLRITSPVTRPSFIIESLRREWRALEDVRWALLLSGERREGLER